MNLKHAFCLGAVAGLSISSLSAQTADPKSGEAAGKHPAAEARPADKPVPEVRTNTVASSDYPIVGYLEKRGRTIVIKSGPKGPLYSVKTPEGKVLFENLSAEQLRAKAPELHEFLKTAMAQSGGKGGAKADASLRLQHR